MIPVSPVAELNSGARRKDKSERVNKTSASRPLRLLLLCDFQQGTASTIIDHVFALKEFSEHSISIFNSRGDISRKFELNGFDGIIIHYSLVACLDTYIGPNIRAAIREFSGLKVAFVQDDYRWINQTIDALRDLGIHVLFGLVPSEIIDQVYSPEKLPGVVREAVLAGCVPEELTKRVVPLLADRPIDVGYRARKLPAWLGSLGQEKWLIADRFQRDAGQFGLVCDLSTREEDRIYGEQWIEFLSNCKAVIGTESGSSICDFTGEIQRSVEAHLVVRPDESFEILRDLYFKDEDGRIVLSVISPRCFEAAALRTLMILYEGYYSGRLQPWRHYVPLKKDHSNMAEVVEVLRDHKRAQAIVDTAFLEVALNPENNFATMVRQIDQAINRAFREEMAAKKIPYDEEELAAIAKRNRRRQQTRKLVRRHLKIAVIKTMWVVENCVPWGGGQRVKRELLKIWPGILDV
jgi:hypothetical protein